MSKPHHVHRSLPSKRETRPFFGPVRIEGQNPAAHGGCRYVHRCACGAVRMENVNGRAHELGPWISADRMLAAAAAIASQRPLERI